jgi:tRNA(Ile)-lysidine synthase
MRPSLLTIARRALRGAVKLDRGASLLVAVSGGPDSMALLDVVGKLGPELGLTVLAHGIDHGLRDGAGAELDLAARLAERLGVPFGRTRVRVARGGNVQARARTARYAALADAATRAGATAIATAHHADDRAETFLIRLLRGAGPRGLAVLPPRSPLPLNETLELVRPLLAARRADVLAHLDRQGIAFATDPSNADPRFVRTRVRRDLLPLMQALDPKIVEHLSTLADHIGPRDEPRSSLPRATQLALEHLVRSGSDQARIWLPGGLVVTREARDTEGAGTAGRARAPRRRKT